MNPAKAHVKAIVAEEFGRHIEEMSEKAVERVHVHNGAVEAFRLGAKRAGELGEHIDKDVKEGIIDEFVGEPLKVAAYAKKYLKRAVGALDNLATAAQIAIHVAEGRAIGLKDANKYVNGIWKEEREKLEAFNRALANDETIDLRGDSVPPAFDGHPGLSLKAQRQAEERLSEEPRAQPPKPESKKTPAKKAPAKKSSKPQTKVAEKARAKAKGK